MFERGVSSSSLQKVDDIQIKTGNVPKKRKRLKALVKNIKEQLEFYFSQSNLKKDRFLSDFVGPDGTKEVPVETILGFNKMKALEASERLICRALENSTDLELVERSSKCYVKRKVALSTTYDPDPCMIYLHNLPLRADATWVRQLCSKIAPVANVQVPINRRNKLPTYQNKGFAFVEFYQQSDALRACALINNPSQNFVHVINRHCSQLTQPTNLRLNKIVKKVLKRFSKTKDNRPTNKLRILDFLRRSGRYSSTEIAAIKNIYFNRNKLRSNCGKSSKKAKKVCKDPPNSSSAKNRGVKRSRDKSKDTFEKEEDQPAEKKSKLEIGAEEMGNEYHLQNGKKEKGPIDEDSGEEGSYRKLQSAVVVPTEKKKRKRVRKNRLLARKHLPQISAPKLRALMKSEWRKVKKEFLSRQRANMGKLKSIMRSLDLPVPSTSTSGFIKHHLALNVCASDREEDDEEDDVIDNVLHQEAYLDPITDPATLDVDIAPPNDENLTSDDEDEDQRLQSFTSTIKPSSSTSLATSKIQSIPFVPNVLVKVTSKVKPRGVDHQTDFKWPKQPPLPKYQVLKQRFSKYGQVEFVDVEKDGLSAVVRFEKAKSAQSAILDESKYKVSLLMKDQEEDYWSKLQTSRETKLGREPVKIRGRKKLIARANKMLDSSSKQHIKFTVDFN